MKNKAKNIWKGITAISFAAIMMVGVLAVMPSVEASPFGDAVANEYTVSLRLEREDVSGGTRFWLTGAVQPFTPGGTDQVVNLRIVGPQEQVVFDGNVALDQEGSYRYEFHFRAENGGWFPVSSSSTSGLYEVSVTYGNASSEALIPVVNQEGSAIIVVADFSDYREEYQEAVSMLGSFAYRTMLSLNLPEDRIYVLHPDLTADLDGDGQADVDALPTYDNLRFAIENWALEKFDMAELASTPLTIYIVTRIGGHNYCYIGENGGVSASDLHNWLNNLKTSIEERQQDAGLPVSGYVPVNFILEFQSSGSFINNLGIIPAVTVVTSSEDAPLPYGRSNMLYGGLLSFSREFLDKIRLGHTVERAFSRAQRYILDYYSNQSPQLDADGNGIPNKLSDELAASCLYLQTRIHNPYLSIVYTGAVSPFVFVGDPVELFAKSNGQVYVVGFPPEKVVSPSFILELTDPDGDRKFTGALQDGFPTRGEWELLYVAIDSDGYIAYPKTMKYTVLPSPKLIVTGREDYTVSGHEFTRYWLSVTNWEEFPDELFEAAPDLPACGDNPAASRTWVDIYDQNDNRLYGFCALSDNEHLQNLWFSVPEGQTPPDSVYITLWDRRCGITYTSNLAGTNLPLVANAGIDKTVNEGETVYFDASGSSDPDEDTMQYRWDFDNDGIWDSDSSYGEYTWNDDYSGEVVLEVSDGVLTDTDTATVTVNNVAPTVSINTALEPITIRITAQVETVDDPDNILGGAINVGDIITGRYTYDCTTADSNPLPTVGDYRHSSQPYGITVNAGGFVFETDPSNVDFIVEIVNDHGDPARDNYLLRSYNNLPLPNGAPVTHIAWQLDDPTATALSSEALLTVPPVLTDWQSIFGLTLDGHDTGDPFGFGYFIRAHGYFIRAHVTAVDAMPNPVDEGSAVTFTGYFDDPSWEDIHTAEWDFGDGNTMVGTFSSGVGFTHHDMDAVTHAYGDDGTYTVTLTVTDDDGGAETDTLIVTVNNVAPSVAAGADQTVNEGDIVSFSGGI